jgi:hypothetical protein
MAPVPAAAAGPFGVDQIAAGGVPRRPLRRRQRPVRGRLRPPLAVRRERMRVIELLVMLL